MLPKDQLEILNSRTMPAHQDRIVVRLCDIPAILFPLPLFHLLLLRISARSCLCGRFVFSIGCFALLRRLPSSLFVPSSPSTSSASSLSILQDFRLRGQMMCWHQCPCRYSFFPLPVDLATAPISAKACFIPRPLLPPCCSSALA